MRPKITIVSPVYPYRGGIANFTEMLYEELKKRADVKIVNFKRQYPSFLFPGKTQFETETVKTIESERLLDSVNPFTWLEVGKKIKTDKPDYLVFAYWHPFFAPAYGVIARKVRKNGKTRIAALCHNVLPHERNFFDLPLTKFFFSAADFAVTLSENVVSDLRKVKPAIKHKTLFHPVYSNFGAPVDKQTACEKLNLSDCEKTLLFFGFIRKYKGLDVLLRAAAVLRKQIEFKLLAAGEFYDDKTEYLKIVSDLGLQDVVIFYDKFIPENEVKYYFSAADVVVLPYRSATQSGIALMANNFFKPVIASDVGGLGEIIKDGVTGYVVKPEDPDAIAKAVLKFYEENNAEKFSANIKAEAEKYSWEKFADELMLFLK